MNRTSPGPHTKASSAPVPSVPAVDLLVPGDIGTLSGGYLYDARIMDGLRALGWRTAIHSLEASFPEPDAEALAAAEKILAEIPQQHAVVVDGLALAGLVPVLERCPLRSAVVALIHHPLAYETGLAAERAARLFELERAALALVETVIVTSAWTGRELGRFDVPAAKIVVVEPGTDRAPLSRGSGGERPALLCIASLTARKGHSILVDALARLADRPWHLRCVGSPTREPETAARLREQIERLGLGDRIELIGELPPAALGEYYDRADLFVLASHLEGFGMVVAEAVARGLPVVTTTAGGAVADTLPAGAGVLVPTGDSRAFADALGVLLDDPRKLAELSAGSARARARLPTWEDASRRFGRTLEARAAE